MNQSTFYKEFMPWARIFSKQTNTLVIVIDTTGLNTKYVYLASVLTFSLTCKPMILSSDTKLPINLKT